MNPISPEKISGTFCEVMEKQVFMFPEPRAAQDIPCEDLRFLSAAMGFRGPRTGTLEIAMPEALAWEVSANFLGLDAGDAFAVEMALDALREMLNIVSGNMLTALFGAEEVFDLTVPEARLLPCEDVQRMAANDSLVFDVEGYPVLLRVGMASPESWKGSV